MLKLYNTLTRKKEIVKSLDYARDKKLKLFVCGITPYDFAHLGHARTYLVFDAFAKYLRSKGLDVFYLQNVTDVDDKIIKRARELGTSWKEVSRTFEKEYFKDMKSLGISSVTKYARATEHIKEIIGQIQRLLKKGYAYEIKNDGIYYNVKKFKEYGKLSRRTVQQAEDGVSRIDESVAKRNKGDFALWKFEAKAWPSPWGPGRPGWHIEDTAITEKYFGPQYDIHGGGRDLMFPHHEAEIAQMEAISGPPRLDGESRLGKKPLARFWMHSGFLTISGEKMSKSLGNFITIQDFLKNHPPRVLRLLFLKTHYRSPIDYSEKLIKQTERELERIDEFVDKIRNPKSTRSSDRVPDRMIGQIRNKFLKALEDDFNTPKAIAVVFDLVRKVNSLLVKSALDKEDAKQILEFLHEMDKIFGFIFVKQKISAVPNEIKNLVEQREQYREQKLWNKADELRKKLLAKGWLIEDTPSGPKLKKAG
ncbi:MAG: cysteinyl-tRNA synthetase [Parcubacteria group bacterium Greene0714_21]|nr:MAG: cysteinyl-tRNA synthetase [Parcubacteria group bacterium Greene0416_39]TSD03855.1 MAG: cysteinyl-tRNA synthetase [Parcubacteria group bacterium Greene0714_21]